MLTLSVISLLGELTDVGRQSTYNFGIALRKLYIEKWVFQSALPPPTNFRTRLGFLPDSLHREGEVYFRYACFLAPAQP